METSESKKIDIIKDRKNMQVIGLVNSNEEAKEVLETMKLFQYITNKINGQRRLKSPLNNPQKYSKERKRKKIWSGIKNERIDKTRKIYYGFKRYCQTGKTAAKNRIF